MVPGWRLMADSVEGAVCALIKKVLEAKSGMAKRSLCTVPAI
jgi:hypothetical protein